MVILPYWPCILVLHQILTFDLFLFQDLSDDLPYSTEYFEYFSPDFSLHPETNPRSENANPKSYLDSIVETTHQQLKMVQHAPSVQMQVG